MSQTSFPFRQVFAVRIGMRLYSQAHEFGGEVTSITQYENEPPQIVLNRDRESVLVPCIPESGLTIWH